MAKPTQNIPDFYLLHLFHYLYIFGSECHENRQKVPQWSSESMHSFHIILCGIHIA